MITDKKIQLFCIHHAGGSNFFYNPLKEHLPSNIEWIPIDISGHGRRSKEPLYTSFDVIRRDVLQKILQECRAPFAIFGHSFGGLLAYMCAQSLRENNLPLPSQLFLSSPASHGSILTPTTHLPSKDFFSHIQSLGGLPDSSISKELLDFLEPLLRADLQALEEWESPLYPALSIPITVFIGTKENEDEIRTYAHKTQGDFTIQRFEGNHFYMQDNWEDLAHIICEKLC